MSAVLADRIAVRGRFARSANVERDSGLREPLDGYVVTARVLDVVERITSTACHGAAGGAWSLTGPYGSGKSSLALLVDVAFGPPTSIRDTALHLIGEASPEAEAAVRGAHDRHGTWNTGFHRGVVTANRESISLTLLRALQVAYGRSPSASARVGPMLRRALADAEGRDPVRAGPSPTSVVRIARAMAEEGPLLLVVDEFGKSLEAARDGQGDPYVLQQLAEAGQGSGLPIFLLTLQHLSFGEYLEGGDGLGREEWAKVQGRFEDVPFVESAAQVRALIGSVFVALDGHMRRRITRWAEAQAKAMRSLGISEVVDSEEVASFYPLHPLAALVLPELCNRYGQHERTLFSFLAGRHPASARRFLAETTIPSRGLLPSLGLESVYDYFVGRDASDAASRHIPGRWTEIATRMRDATDLTERQTRVAKSVGVLNLIASTGVVRASRELLRVTEPDAGNVLVELEDLGIVTHRRFADEYRVWEGSDIDVGGLIEAARRSIRQQALADLLSELDPLPPVVAARHSAEKDVLRVFKRRYADAARPVEPLDPFDPYDGESLLIVDSIDAIPRLDGGVESAKPVVAAIPRDVAKLQAAARQVLAIRKCIDDPIVAADRVARRELAERLEHAQGTLAERAHEAFRPEACRWVLLGPSGVTELRGGRGSHALSHAADRAFPSTPTIGNEVLNRSRLTSQGAKARRLLISAMIEREGDADLGLTGFGPEVAMYRAFLERTGVHGIRSEDGAFRLGAPAAGDSLERAWEVIEDQFTRAKEDRINLRDIHAALLSKPIGMKEGPILVLVVAALLAFRDEIAIYEHGTFRPVLSVELSERLVRNPHHFDVKHFANLEGARGAVIDVLARGLGARPLARRFRVPNVVAIAGHLISTVRRMSRFTRKTRSLGPHAMAAREAITTAVEPDELLFAGLPDCFGLPVVPAESTHYQHATEYAESLGSAMDELTGRQRNLEEEILADVLRTAAERSRLAVSGQAASLDGEVLDPAVRAFVLTLRGDTDATETQWACSIATTVAKKAPTEWTDGDQARFRHELRVHMEAFHRLVALHADSRVKTGGPFDVYRITITRPDGAEHNRLVDVAEADRLRADDAVEAAIATLSGGGESYEIAEKALLANLGRRLFARQAEHASKPSTPSRPRRMRHA